jgi:hypothetical protein
MDKEALSKLIDDLDKLGFYRYSFAYELYSEEERRSGDIWDLTSRRVFAIINRLLAQAGSDERIYQVYKWNDCTGVVLTKETYERILSAGLLTENELPVQIPEWRAYCSCVAVPG